jgi:hypothetical protein
MSIKLKDLEIYIENALDNYKRGVWDRKTAQLFILMKMNNFKGGLIKKDG